MTDKTREEFEAWHKRASPQWQDAWGAWKRQQAIIDARDAEISRLNNKINDLQADARRSKRGMVRLNCETGEPE